MRLYELAFACHIYGGMSNDDSSYDEFLKATNSAPDLTLAEHRIALIKWLNKWGCRQSAKSYHHLASEEIRLWFEECHNSLPPSDLCLLELSDDDISSASEAFAELADRQASIRRNPPVRVGPAGAAKTLFALRPDALPPWDNAIRDKLNSTTTAASYGDYLNMVKGELEELRAACGRNGYDLADLPKLVGRPTSTLVKLVDEYFWVTITAGCPVPKVDTLVRWTAWQ